MFRKVTSAEVEGCFHTEPVCIGSIIAWWICPFISLHVGVSENCQSMQIKQADGEKESQQPNKHGSSLFVMRKKTEQPQNFMFSCWQFHNSELNYIYLLMRVSNINRECLYVYADAFVTMATHRRIIMWETLLNVYMARKSVCSPVELVSSPQDVTLLY